MSLFGDFLEKISFVDKSKDDRIKTNQIASDYRDGATEVNYDAIDNFAFNLNWSYTDQNDLIQKYRNISHYPIVDYAIEDIVNEMVSFDEEEDPVELDLTDISGDMSESILNKIYESWNHVTNMLDLRSTIHDKARSFYIDGRLAYQKVIDKNKLTAGVIGIVELDTRCIKKYRSIEYDDESKTIKEIKEYFVYDESVKRRESQNKNNYRYNEAMALNKDSIVYVTSGLIDKNTGEAIGWLHKAVKPANLLRMMENSLVIYRMTRAPERRIFYVDTSSLTNTKAEQFIRNLKNNYRNRMSFDTENGTFTDEKHLQTMQEDFWLPRNSSGRGTEVSTLPGGQNLSEIEDVRYFEKQLYKALNSPISRLEPDSAISLGRASEITRDELKFNKFVSKIRKRFNMMFIDILGSDLILKKIITVSEWEKIKNKIKFRYSLDMYIEESKESEIFRDRLEILRDSSEYIGKYFSHQYIREKVLKQTDKEIKDIDKEIEKDKNNKNYNSENLED